MSHPCPCCGKILVSGTLNARTIDTLMVYSHRDSFRPLGFVKLDDMQALEELSCCEKTRWLFNYEPGFTSPKKRRVIIVDLD